jgi:hypothetical protein
MLGLDGVDRDIRSVEDFVFVKDQIMKSERENTSKGKITN